MSAPDDAAHTIRVAATAEEKGGAPGPAVRVANFGAGPAKLPAEVVREAQHDLANWRGCGLGILEVSHRSAQFEECMEACEERLRSLVKIPPNYAVLLMSGGGTLQFAAVLYNLLLRTPSGAPSASTDGEGRAVLPSVDYIISGVWSQKAADEAKKLLLPPDGGAPLVAVNEIPFECKGGAAVARGAPPPSLEAAVGKIGARSQFVYYCDNETVDGVEFPSSSAVADAIQARRRASLNGGQMEGAAADGVPIVADMSSNILSRPIDVAKFGVIFATAQKNFGPAGATVVIVERGLIARASRATDRLLPTPTMMDYAVMEKSRSLYNTPPTFAIHTSSLVIEWIIKTFANDLAAVDAFSRRKAAIIYAAIARSATLYRAIVPPTFASRMNVVFRIGAPAEAALEAAFVEEALALGLLQLGGHRSVGGIRVSLYNAITEEEVSRVAAFMDAFAAKHDARMLPCPLSL